MKHDIFEQEILPLFEDTRSDWLQIARAEAKRLGKLQPMVSADDVRRNCPPPLGKDPRVMGSIFYPRSDWIRLKVSRSDRRTCHNRPITFWQYRYR
jgi:hypothetical protein